MKDTSVLVVFSEKFPHKSLKWWKKFDVVIAHASLEDDVRMTGCQFETLATYVGPGSIYEASILAEELSLLKFSNGKRISKSFVYKGYELWWTNYDTLFFYYCLPYTQHKKLLEYLKNFKEVFLFEPPYERLFASYLHAHGSGTHILHGLNFKSPSFLPLGVIFQMLITLASLPMLVIQKRHIMMFTSDEFDGQRDFNFRMRFLYEELRERKLPFVEFIRSIEPWRRVLTHAWKRKRPVIYTDAITFFGRFISVVSGGRRRAKKRFGEQTFGSLTNSDARFKMLIGTQFLLCVYDDIWAIRIERIILRMIGIKSGIILAAMGRNFHTVLACKLNNIPTIGILHGVASPSYNLYEFMPAFDSEKTLSVDKYGLWSEWWKEYFLKHSKAYRPEQLYVSGPMRPLQVFDKKDDVPSPQGLVRVLFMSEQNAVPEEVMPYLNELASRKDMELTIKFRPHYDAFEQWLIKHEPQILKLPHIQIVKGGMQEAIQNVDIAVGCQGTGVLEALAQLKVPIFFRTGKWGDYYSMTEYNNTQCFFAENPQELIEKIKQAHTIPKTFLAELCERYFGNPYKNGSAWVIEEVEKSL